MTWYSIFASFFQILKLKNQTDRCDVKEFYEFKKTIRLTVSGWKDRYKQPTGNEQGSVLIRIMPEV